MADPVIVRLLGSGEPAVDCDVCFDQLDRYVELEISRGPADEVFPGLRAHLAGCPACAEEHESLRALLEMEAVSPLAEVD
jgi:anti-sigma factor RsiW